MPVDVLSYARDLAEKERECDALRAQLSAAQAEIAEKDLQIAACRDKIAGLKGNYDAQVAKNSALAKEIVAVAAQITTLRTLLTDLYKEVVEGGSSKAWEAARDYLSQLAQEEKS